MPWKVLTGAIRPCILVTVLVAGLFVCCPAVPSTTAVTNERPLLFEENRGQFSQSVDFVARGQGYSVVLGDHPVIELYRFSKVPSAAPAGLDQPEPFHTRLDDVTKLRMRFLGAASDSKPVPLEKQPSLTHYLVGQESDWKTDIPNYGRIRYGGILPDIDVEYYGSDGRLEYDFLVHPGADPSAIALHFEGADAVRVNDDGDLVLLFGERELLQRAPVAYQPGARDERIEIASRYVIRDGVVGFDLAVHDPTKLLIIDPVIEYSRYFGGPNSEQAFAVDVDAADNIYVFGQTASPALGTLGAFNQTSQVVRTERTSVCAMSSPCELLITSGTVTAANAGTLLIDASASFIPGDPFGTPTDDGTIRGGDLILNLSDRSRSRVDTVDSLNQISHDPLDFGLQNEWQVGDRYEIWGERQAPEAERIHIESIERNLMITKFSPDGTTVLYSTYLASNLANGSLLAPINSGAVSDAGEFGFGISRAPAGLPLVNPTQSSGDVYLGRLNSSGNGLVFATYLDTNFPGFGLIRGLDVAGDGTLAATGFLLSVYEEINNFPELNPIVSCSIDPSEFPRPSGWIVQFSPAGDLEFSSCLSGFGSQWLRGVDIGANGHLYVLGYYFPFGEPDFPLVSPIQDTILEIAYEDEQGFQSTIPVRTMTISEIDPDTATLVFSTYFGPTAPGLPPIGPTREYDVARAAGEAVLPADIVTDAAGNIWVTGSTYFLNYPTVNAFQPNLAVPRSLADFLSRDEAELYFGVNDIYLTKLNPTDGVIFSTYVGGHSTEEGFPSLALDDEGNVYVSLITHSGDYPLLNPIQGTPPGLPSVGLSKFTPSGALAFSTYLGGSDNGLMQVPGGVAINSSGDIIVASYTRSDDFPNDLSGTSRSGGSDMTLTIIDQSADTDTDGDGVPDAVDEFPTDDSEWIDTDDDETGNNADTDDDGDGVPDEFDRFPLDDSEFVDSDHDGAGDTLDQFDLDPVPLSVFYNVNYFDLDGDGIGDFADTDADGDGVNDVDDQLDFDASETLDTDGDGIGNGVDTDDDNDGFPDDEDPQPLDSQRPVLNFENFSALDREAFPSGLPEGFQPVAGIDKTWTSATDQSHSGTVSLGSRIIADGETTSIDYIVDFDLGGTLEFWYRVDSEMFADRLTVFIGGNSVLTASGSVDWTKFSTSVGRGVKVIRFSYAKNASGSAGDDAAWIDDIRIDISSDRIFASGFEAP